MKTLIRLTLSVFSLMFTIGALPASAQQKHHYELKIGDFTNLRILNDVNVVWKSHPDSAGYVRFYAEERFADAFIFDNNGKGLLKVRIAYDISGEGEFPTIYLYSNSLTTVRNASNCNLTIYNPPITSKFKAEEIGNGSISIYGLQCSKVEAVINTGNGRVTLRGKAQNADFRMIGTGEIRALDLICNECKCSIFGTGAIYCNVLKSLKVQGVGSTSIYYKGSPQQVKKRGGGKLIHVE